jgi:hypothetical protein
VTRHTTVQVRPAPLERAEALWLIGGTGRDNLADEGDKDAVRFEVTQQAPGQDAPTSTVTDAAGVDVLLTRAAATGGRLHIRPHTPDPRPAPDTAGARSEGDPQE